jgi:hypothetical protein
MWVKAVHPCLAPFRRMVDMAGEVVAGKRSGLCSGLRGRLGPGRGALRRLVVSP